MDNSGFMLCRSHTAEFCYIHVCNEKGSSWLAASPGLLVMISIVNSSHSEISIPSVLELLEIADYFRQSISDFLGLLHIISSLSE